MFNKIDDIFSKIKLILAFFIVKNAGKKKEQVKNMKKRNKKLQKNTKTLKKKIKLINKISKDNEKTYTSSIAANVNWMRDNGMLDE